MAGTDEVKFWIMGWESHALVLEPANLKDEIRIELMAILEKYGEELGQEERLGVCENVKLFFRKPLARTNRN